MLARRIGRPLHRFLRIEAAGGILLLIATAAALIWANSPWQDSYHEILGTHVRIGLGSLIILDEPVEAWINDALMAIFFFVVGLEIKREIIVGELRDPRAAAMPAMAALGGMVVPALVYFAFNPTGPAADGWGIPMATDIAFTLGVVSLLGARVPTTIKISLLTLAIVDDIGAILVIAIFYTDDLSAEWLLVAVLGIGTFLVLRLAGVWYAPAYVAIGMFIWLAVFESGVHATIAGVIVGIMTPAQPLIDSGRVGEELVGQTAGQDVSAPIVRRAYFELREHVSVAERLDDILHPWSSFVIIPIFALANAGVELSLDSLAEAARSPVTHGIVVGLVVGKLVGVSLFTWAGVRTGLCRLPSGANWSHIIGLGAVAGIGFTVSLFISGLAFDPDGLTGGLGDEAKIAILAASALAAIVGAVVFAASGTGSRLEPDRDRPEPGVASSPRNTR